MTRTTTTTKAPKINPLHFGTLTDGDPATLLRNADLTSERFTDLRLEDLTIPHSRIESTQLLGITANTADLTGSRFIEVELDRIDIPVIRATRTRWDDVTLNGRLGSIEAYDATWASVHFHNCKLSFVNLRGTQLTDVEFTDCVIEDLDLTGVTARRVRLNDTHVANLNIQDSELHDVDLRDARLGFVSDPHQLRGATISMHQLTDFAPQMANRLGLIVDA